MTFCMMACFGGTNTQSTVNNFHDTTASQTKVAGVPRGLLLPGVKKSVAEHSLERNIPSPGFSLVTEGLKDWLAEQGNLGRGAVDFGAGGGCDSRELLKAGFHVVAIDKDPEFHAFKATSLGQREFESIRAQRLFKLLGGVEQLQMVKAGAAIFNAQRVAPHLNSVELDQLLFHANGILSDDGKLSISFFGTEHSWNDGMKPMRFFDEATVRMRLHNAGFQIDKFETLERNNYESICEGVVPKWQEFMIIASKRS